VLRDAGYDDEAIARMAESGAVGGPVAETQGFVPSVAETGLLKMSELAEASGVSSGTIKHYVREGLLPEPVKTVAQTWPTTRPSSSSASG